MKPNLSSVKTFLANNSNAFLGHLMLSVLIGFSSNLILSRLLEPEAFAVAGLIASIIFTTHLLSDAGFAPYVIRHAEGNNDKLLDTVWSIRLVRGLVLTLIIGLLAYPFARFIGSPQLGLAISICSLVFLVEGFQAMSPIVSEHKDRVAKPLYIDLFLLLLSKFVIISIAVFTGNYWAFVVGIIVTALAKVVTSHRLYESGTRRFSITKIYLLEFWQFSKIILPSSIITVILMQGDKIVLSKNLSLSDLGLYYLALSFSQIGSHFINGFSTRILLPYLSKIRRTTPSLLESKFYEKKSHLLFLAMIGLGCLAGGATLFMEFLYPEAYHPAAIFLTILLLHPILCCVSKPVETCLFSFGETRVNLQSNILRLAWVVIVSPFALHYFGALGFVFAFSTREIPALVYLLYRAYLANLVRLAAEFQLFLVAVLSYLASNSVLG